MHASAAGSKPPGSAGWTRLRQNWRSISSAATSSRTRSRTTSAPPPRPCAAAPTRRQSVICSGRSMLSGTSRTRLSASGSKSNCSSGSGPRSWRPEGLGHRRCWRHIPGPGELADVRAHAEAGLALYEARIHQAMASSYGNHDASTCARNFAALSLALAGEDERARAMAETSLTVARSLNDPFSLALTLYFASAVAQVLGDVLGAAQRAEASRQIAAEHDLAVVGAWSTGVAGWCAAE